MHDEDSPAPPAPALICSSLSSTSQLRGGHDLRLEELSVLPLAALSAALYRAVGGQDKDDTVLMSSATIKVAIQQKSTLIVTADKTPGETLGFWGLLSRDCLWNSEIWALEKVVFAVNNLLNMRVAPPSINSRGGFCTDLPHLPNSTYRNWGIASVPKYQKNSNSLASILCLFNLQNLEG